MVSYSMRKVKWDLQIIFKKVQEYVCSEILDVYEEGYCKKTVIIAQFINQCKITKYLQ